MSVKHAMLALLAAEPSSTYQLRKRFDASTGQGLPLNIGQVSSTLQRLERDGMVTRDGMVDLGGGNPGAHDNGAGPETAAGAGQRWQLLAPGRDELSKWWARPVVAEQRGRDELVLKLTLAAVIPGVDVAALLQTQRAATQRAMHDLTKVRRGIDAGDLVPRLVVDHHLFITEAELRWIDDVEAALVQRAAAASRAASIAGGASEQSLAHSAPGNTGTAGTAGTENIVAATPSNPAEMR